MKMVYTSKRGEQIVFDDFVDSIRDHGSYWGELCPHCHNKYKDILGQRVDDGGTACGTCSVEGCDNEADYYVDFSENEVNIM